MNHIDTIRNKKKVFRKQPNATMVQQKIVTNVYHILHRISALYKAECQKIKAKISGAKNQI